MLAPWSVLLVLFPLNAWVFTSVKDTTYTEDKAVYVDEVKNRKLDPNVGVDEKEPGPNCANRWFSYAIYR